MSARRESMRRHLGAEVARAPRTCGACGLTSDGSDDWGGPDPCLGLLPGIVSACCGHGTGAPADYPYLWLPDGSKISGPQALARMRQLGGNPP